MMMNTSFVRRALLVLSLLLVVPNGSHASLVGVCYGLLGDNLPPPAEAVQLLNGLGITRVRLYSPSADHINALRNTGIEVTVGVPNEELQQCASSPDYAGTWVYDNVLQYMPDVTFRYIAVGNEVFGTPDAQYVGPAMQNIYNAVAAAGQGMQVKVSTAVHMAVMAPNSYPPSAGAFSDEALPFMNPILQLLEQTSSPLLLNLYPYFAFKGNTAQIPLPFAIFTQENDQFVDSGSNLPYRTLFDAMLDTFYTAMEKLGYPNTEVVISESGWPSDGGDPAIDNSANAEAYNNNLVKYAINGLGSPKRPGTSLETYVFALFNEDQKTGDPTENHYGLFYPDKQPVYPFTLPA